jgi:hypothetical protein
VSGLLPCPLRFVLEKRLAAVDQWRKPDNSLVMAPNIRHPCLRRSMLRFIPGVLLVALSIWLVCCADPCENRVISDVQAPSGNKGAIVFERSCGATTGFSTQVSVVNAFGTPKSAGNVFRADSDHGVAKDMTVTVRWSGPDQLVIRYPSSARIFKKETRVNGVAVA